MGEDDPHPPAAGNANRDADHGGDEAQRRGLPRHGRTHLARREAEGLEHGEVTSAPADRGHQQMGERGHGQRAEQGSEQHRQALDTAEVDEVGGSLRPDDVVTARSEGA